MDSPFSLNTASTSTLIIQMPSDDNNPDATTKNHLGLTVDATSQLNARPVIAIQTRPHSQPLRTPQLPETAKMSGNGFVQPHISHLPRRSRTTVRRQSAVHISQQMRSVSWARGRTMSSSSSSSSGMGPAVLANHAAMNDENRTDRATGKGTDANGVEERPNGVLDVHTSDETKATQQTAHVQERNHESSNDFDSNKTENNFNPELDSEPNATRTEGHPRAASYALRKFLGGDSSGGLTPPTPPSASNDVDLNVPSTSKRVHIPAHLLLNSLPDASSSNLLAPGSGLPSGVATAPLQQPQHLQPHVAHLPRRFNRSRSRHHRRSRDFDVGDVERFRSAVSFARRAGKRSVSVDSRNVDSRLGDINEKNRRAASLGRRGDETVPEHPHPRLDTRRPAPARFSFGRGQQNGYEFMKGGAERLVERMKLQEVGVGSGVWVGIDVASEDNLYGYYSHQHRRAKNEREKATVDVFRKWDDIERVLPQSGSKGPRRKRKLGGLIWIVGYPSIDEGESESEGEDEELYNPAISYRVTNIGCPRTLTSGSGSASEEHASTLTLDISSMKEKEGPMERGCTRLSVEQMKEGCMFIRGVNAANGRDQRDVGPRDDKTEGNDDDEQCVTLILTSSEDGMVDAFSMALCWLVVKEMEGAGGGKEKDRSKEKTENEDDNETSVQGVGENGDDSSSKPQAERLDQGEEAPEMEKESSGTRETEWEEVTAEPAQLTQAEEAESVMDVTIVRDCDPSVRPLEEEATTEKREEDTIITESGVKGDIQERAPDGGLPEGRGTNDEGSGVKDDVEVKDGIEAQSLHHEEDTSTEVQIKDGIVEEVKFEGDVKDKEEDREAKEEYTSVHRLLWKLHDDYGYQSEVKDGTRGARGWGTSPSDNEEDEEIDIEGTGLGSNVKVKVNGNADSEGSNLKAQLNLPPRLPALLSPRRFDSFEMGDQSGGIKVCLRDEWRGLISFEGGWKVWRGVKATIDQR